MKDWFTIVRIATLGQLQEKVILRGTSVSNIQIKTQSKEDEILQEEGCTVHIHIYVHFTYSNGHFKRHFEGIVRFNCHDIMNCSFGSSEKKNQWLLIRMKVMSKLKT